MDRRCHFVDDRAIPVAQREDQHILPEAIGSFRIVGVNENAWADEMRESIRGRWIRHPDTCISYNASDVARQERVDGRTRHRRPNGVRGGPARYLE